jgi:DNA-binding NarL/FixJ family response regulator
MGFTAMRARRKEAPLGAREGEAGVQASGSFEAALIPRGEWSGSQFEVANAHPMIMALAPRTAARIVPDLDCRAWTHRMQPPSPQTGPERTVTVLLVEDDAPTCGRLRDALADAGDFAVTTAGTLTEARAALAAAHPQVLLTDLQLPDGHGVELIRETRLVSPSTEIMVISILGDEQSVISAIMVGATGYLLKDAFPTDIAATVRDLVAGHSPISASIARFIVRRTQSANAADASGTNTNPAMPRLNTARLTPREIDILWGIAKGFSYAEIAGSLGLSRQTVPGHIKSIYRKLEVNTRGEAVFEALQQGLIRL